MKSIERSIKKFNKKINSDRFLSPRSLFKSNSADNDFPVTQFVPNDTFITNIVDNKMDTGYNEYTQSGNSQSQEDKIYEEIVKYENDQNNLSVYLPRQLQRNFIKNTFRFTMMVVGQSGLGKSTFINSLFFTDIYNDKYPGPTKRAKKTLNIESNSVLINENSVNVLLTIVDTPGFGDALNNTNCWQAIEKHIEQKNYNYLKSEFSFGKKFQDERIHCCLYFIRPTGQSLTAIDIEFMKRLSNKVNLIPIIAKADSLTTDELAEFKKNIMNDLEKNQIKIYQFESEMVSESILDLKNRIPFAIVSSNYVIEERGQRFFGRQYPWGTVNIENLDHCDFKALQNLLIKKHLYSLVDCTHKIHYEDYRKANLEKMKKYKFETLFN